VKIARVTLQYGILIALAAFLLSWLEYRHATRLFSTEIYIALIAVFFAGLGIWVGNRLTTKPADDLFEKNVKALATLGITNREYDVLCLLEQGRTNKEIARSLGISPNTVKSHLAHLYDKLTVATRTQAIRQAKTLRLIP